MNLQRNTFSGTISRGDELYPVGFHISAGVDFRLRIEIDPLTPQTLIHLQAAIGEPGSYLQSLTLEGEAADGTSFFSESVHIVEVKFGASKNEITVSALKATVTECRPEAILRPVLRLWLRSFTSPWNSIVQTSLGKVEVRGNEKKITEDEVSGSITVCAVDDTNLTDWQIRANDFLTFMHGGLEFAHGSRLQTPRVDLEIENRSEATFYEGSTFGPGLPPIHRLHKGSFIKALAGRYDQEKPFPDILWTAIGWLQSDSISHQGRFLTSMTALETIVEHLIPKTQSTIIPKPDFARLRDQLLDVVRASSLPETAHQIFIEKVKGLNRRSLSQKIEDLRDYYGLSADIFDTASIVSIVKLRNDIVHTGTTQKGDCWPKVVFIRELISQIMFREVGYAGPYESYLRGYKMVHPERPMR